MQLQNLSTDIEKINRKKNSNGELDKSDTEKRDKIQISDEVTMIARKKMMMMIKLIKMLIKEEVKKNQKKKTRQKKAKICFSIRYIRTWGKI